MKKGFTLFSLLVVSFLLFSGSAKAFGLHFSTSLPGDTTICQSADSIKFTVATLDSPTALVVSYQWMVSTNGGVSYTAATGSNYSGATTSLFTIYTLGTTSLSGYKFICMATDTIGGTATSDTLKLIVLAPVAPGTISGSTSLCIGSSAAYTETTSGGVWSVSNDTFATISSTGILTGIAKGAVTLSYSISNVCGTYVASSGTIQIDTLPAAGMISGLDNVCNGSGISLTESLPGGVWSSTTTTVATVGTSGLVTSVAQGFDTIKYTITNSIGCAGIASMVVRVDTFAVPLPISGPTVTCVGHTITLTDMNVFGISIWSVSNTINASVNSSGDVSGLHGGMDTVNMVFTNACNSVDTNFVVEIDTPLASGTITGLTSVCSGSWIHLTSSMTGGFWLTSNSAIATVDGSGDVTGIDQGTAIISYVFENACGVSAAVYTITVFNPASSIAAISDSVGIDSTRALSDTALGGTWSSSDPLIATVNATTGVVTGQSTGAAIITYSVTNICGTTYSVFIINVGALPSAGAISPAIDSVCIDSTIGLTESVSGGTWFSGNTSIATVSNEGIVSGISLGLVNITYTVTNAFGSSFTTRAVYVNSTPVIHINFPNILAIGGNYFPIASPEGGHWTSSNYSVGYLDFSAFGYSLDTTIGGVRTTGGTFCSLIIVNGGIDTLHYIYTNACGTADSIRIINIPAASSVNTITGSTGSITLYPNPNNGSFTLNLPSATPENADVVITNIVGQEVKEMTISTNQLTNVNLDLPSGTYFVTAKTPTNRYAAKFTVTR